MSLLRQPFVHFLLIGAAFFALFQLVSDDPSPANVGESVVVSVQDARWLADQFQATWRRPPSEDELDALIDEFIREEIYVREALALGLDQGDAIVRRRLRQKMEFLSEASAEAANPADDVLQVYYQENADRFEVAPRIAFSQVLLGQADPDEVRTALEAGQDPASVGQRTLLPGTLPLSPATAIDGTFGNGFFDQLVRVEIGTWVGPVQSGYGIHLVRIDSLEEAQLPPFEAVRDRVELEWRSETAARLREERFRAFADRYSIERPDPGAVLQQ